VKKNVNTATPRRVLDTKNRKAILSKKILGYAENATNTFGTSRPHPPDFERSRTYEKGEEIK